MTFRPRYSLLTLLILTALIAGGVKLWHGPHTVIEERAPGKQLEYTYTRTWNGEKIVHGPSIIRFVAPNGLVLCIAVTYVTKDEQLCCNYQFLQRRKNSTTQQILLSDKDFKVIEQLPISASEQSTLRQVIERERRRIDQASAEGYTWFETMYSTGKPSDTKGIDFKDWVKSYAAVCRISWQDLMDQM